MCCGAHIAAIVTCVTRKFPGFSLNEFFASALTEGRVHLKAYFIHEALGRAVYGYDWRSAT
ncbi:hypothetical protein LF95_19430 [Thalassospira sp. TSL5-1]|nr:hypothetical protein LF95_19430 [Thalassospira sp. TSL5-1]